MAEVTTPIEEESALSREEIFVKEVDKGIAHFLDLTDREFRPDGQNPQIYHVRKHPEIVIDRVERLGGRIMEVAPQLLTLHQFHTARLDGAAHDVIQAFDSNEDAGTIREKRVRHRGPNEKDSGDELVDYMRSVNEKFLKENGYEIFSEDDIAQVDPTMKGTEPEWDKIRQTATQPHINTESPIEAKLVGLADLGGSGMDGAKQYIKEGNSEFLEVRIGITRALTNATNDSRGLDSLTEEDKKYIGSEIKEWLNSQINFVEGRKYYLDQELSHFNNPELSEILKIEQFNSTNLMNLLKQLRKELS